ncbi:MAG: hypothetical protein ACRDS0_10805 [Pseudonocardiaceae bacterium]
MPAPGDDIESRLSTVEALNALRETQVDFGRQLAGQGSRIDALDRKIDEQSREMREGFSTLATGMAQITALLTNRESDGLD